MTDAPIPGLTADREALNAAAAELVRAATERRAPLGAYVLHLQPEGVTMERRVDLVRFYREAGARELAKKLRAAVVPPTHLLVLIDAEETHLTLVPVSAFGGA